MTDSVCPHYATRTRRLQSQETTSHRMRQATLVRVVWCDHPTDSPSPAPKGLGSRRYLPCEGDVEKCPIQHLL